MPSICDYLCIGMGNEKRISQFLKQKFRRFLSVFLSEGRQWGISYLLRPCPIYLPCLYAKSYDSNMRVFKVQPCLLINKKKSLKELPIERLPRTVAILNSALRITLWLLAEEPKLLEFKARRRKRDKNDLKIRHSKIPHGHKKPMSN
ncbi:hypothetical protein CEXT_786881 [Caerostris extrusa]|uniref:Uncharacterized protein n=1 Tax=Caerostris extrusa TaxID=172846 RepID=A0AAV4Y9Y7_CAEEX|nr:hypothetical protein CEXT_786881 [Caerostris extrusa]